MALFESFDASESKFNAPIQAEDKEIKNYEMTNKILYPYLLLESKTNLPEHKVRVLKNSLEEIPYIHNKVEDGYFDVLLKIQDNIFIMGMVHTDNLKVILNSSLFADLEKSLRLNKEEVVQGQMIYAFCTSPNY